MCVCVTCVCAMCVDGKESKCACASVCVGESRPWGWLELTQRTSVCSECIDWPWTQTLGTDCVRLSERHFRSPK